MPFTPTHIVAILPMVRGRSRLPISALVVGSQVPDLPMYIPPGLPFDERFLHTPIGLLVACLPLGLLGTVWMDQLAKGPLIDSLPEPWRARLAPLKQPELQASYGAFGWALLAVGLGSLTHVLWDNFTHDNTWAYRHLPVLSSPVATVGTSTIEVYKALQYGCTLVLLPSLLVWLAYRAWRLPPQPTAPPSLPAVHRRRWAIVLILICPALAAAWAAFRSTQSQEVWRTFAVTGVTTLGWLHFWGINAFIGHYHRQQQRALTD